MSAPMPTWVVSVTLDDDLLLLNRVVGIVRRRTLPVAGLAIGPGAGPGLARITAVVEADQPAVERMAAQLRKAVGVHRCETVAEGDCTLREHLLARVRPAPARLGDLLDLLGLYQATVVEERAPELLIEATGTPPRILSLLRALEPFGIADCVRGPAIGLRHAGRDEPAAGPVRALQDGNDAAAAIPA